MISLHGHLFMNWPSTSIKAKLLRWIMTRSSKVTVLGFFQKEKLIEMGMKHDKINSK